jgi:HD-GYP domain-containing protein (c-di-GMP phosphodiesterase class II)
MGVEESMKIRLWVAMIAILGAGCLVGGWFVGVPYPGLWALTSFVVAGFMLERTNSDLRFSAQGSTSFVVHIAAGILFGPFWGGLVTAVSTGLGQAADGKPLIKAVFNVSQRVVSLAGGMLLLGRLGAQFPLFGFASINPGAGPDVQDRLWMFVLSAVFYFGVNTTAVSTAVALSANRRFREVWSINARGVLGYDLAASFLAILLAWLYVRFDQWYGMGAIGFILALAPILVIRHIYGLYRRLQNSGRELLDLMVKAIEARDPYTSGHSVRVATLSKAIAQEVKMSVEQVEEVYTAAVLHDVGKIHEEFAPLLRKDSKLTPDEMALLQTHSAKSADLVGIISNFRGRIQQAVRNHHERWDGGGYPDGLAGEAIPLGARIIMISDTADAMTTDRPYRKKLPLEAVISELVKYRATQFDPKLVDLVVNSVTIRRVMADLQGATPAAQPSEQAALGGSKRVMPGSQDEPRKRPSWIRVGSF